MFAEVWQGSRVQLWIGESLYGKPRFGSYVMAKLVKIGLGAMWQSW